MTNIAAMADQLRERMANVKGIDPSGKFYLGVCKALDRCDDDALRAVYNAKIKFISALAWNRMLRRGLVKVAPL